MGIGAATFRELTELGTRIARPKAAVMLGRQRCKLIYRHRKHYRRALDANGLGEVDLESMFTKSGYAEQPLEKLGFGTVESMDFSDYEGAEHLVDLSKPLAPEFHQRFDFVLDGGTLEHVFNLPQAFCNVFSMLKPGGTFVSINGFTGWPGHGFYQFQPDLVWSFWKYMANCDVRRCIALPLNPRDATFDLPDNRGSARRLEYHSQVPAGRVSLYFEVFKPEGARLEGEVQQADYETKWHRATELEHES